MVRREYLRCLQSFSKNSLFTIRPLTLGQMCLIEADFIHINRFYSTNALIERLLCLLMFNVI